MDISQKYNILPNRYFCIFRRIIHFLISIDIIYLIEYKYKVKICNKYFTGMFSN